MFCDGDNSSTCTNPFNATTFTTDFTDGSDTDSDGDTLDHDND